MPWEWAAHCHSLSVPQPACSVIYHFLQLTKRCEFSWMVHVGWYINMIHLTHCCIILPFVWCRCDLSRMLCGNFPVTLIVAAWEQLPVVGNSWRSKQVQVWARSDPAGCEKMNKLFWKVSPATVFHTGQLSHETGYKWISTSLAASRFSSSCVQKKAEVQQGGCLLDAAKVPSQTVLHLHNALYLSGLYPVEGSVEYWPGDDISF